MPKGIDFNKIKEFPQRISKIPRFLGENPFLAFFIFLFIAVVIGSLVFYKYSLLATKLEQQAFKKSLQIDETAYKKVLEEWKLREKKFEEAEFRPYPDPFRGPVLIETKTATP